MPRRGRLRCLTSRNRTCGSHPIHNTPPSPPIPAPLTAKSQQTPRSWAAGPFNSWSSRTKPEQQNELHLRLSNYARSSQVVLLGPREQVTPGARVFYGALRVFAPGGPYYIVANNHCPPSDAGKWGLSTGFWDVREANSRLGRYPAISGEGRLGCYQIGPPLLSGVSWFAQNPIFEAPAQERHMVLQSHDVSNFNSHY